MKKIIIFTILSTILLAETIDITPPSFKNMNNYNANVKSSSSKQPIIINNNYNNTDNNTTKTISSNVVDGNEQNNKNSQQTNNANTNTTVNKVETDNSNKNAPKTIATYDKTISSDVIDNNGVDKVDNCTYLIKSVYENAYEKGYEKGNINSKYEIENLLISIKSSLDDIFMIKQYYIEGIVEPPFINFDNESNILDGGKRYVKKEGEYSIVKPAKFKQPLKWEDFLLTGFLKEPEYKFDYVFNIAKGCEIDDEKIKESFLNGYEYSRKENIVLYSERLKKLKDYMLKLNLYQRLYLSKKILPPVITPMVTPIKAENDNLLISEEQYVIVKPAQFNPLYKNWLNFIVENNNKTTVNKRK